MTFIEAAEAVLRKAGKPLHFKKITQYAIEQNLLSHVGKTPEVTMSTRLATLVKKAEGDVAILRVKPGVFGLREWGENQTSDEPEEPGDEPLLADDPGEDGGRVAHASASESPPPPQTPEERERAQRIEAAAQLFPVEDDDDVPILADRPRPPPPPPPPPREETPPATQTALEGATGTGDAAGGSAADARTGDPRGEGEGGRRRRRRRRRGRGDRPEGAGEGGEALADGAEEGDDGDDEGEDVLDAPAFGAEGSGDEEGEGQREGDGEVRARGEGGENREAREPRRDDRGHTHEGREGRRDNREPRQDRRDTRDSRRDEIALDEVGRDAAELLITLLSRRDERGPVGLRSVVDEAVRAGKLNGDVHVLSAALSAAARADTARREARGERARVRVAGGRVGLIDWVLGPEVVRAESDAFATLERLREIVRRQVVRKLNELPQSGFVELLAMLLEKLGISTMRTIRRPGLAQGEVHLSGIARRASEDTRLAIILKRGGEIGRERVIDLRGSLHHYAQATGAWVVTTGSVLSGAREEAQQPGTAPVTLIDGVALGRLLDEHGVGVRHAQVSIPYGDLDLFDALRM